MVDPHRERHQQGLFVAHAVSVGHRELGRLVEGEGGSVAVVGRGA